ncbi:penicillin-binding protein 2 [Marivirga arenosa]|uniref:Penicillin-binding protein 2 n=1 Tax=Marivirga arenosa TaxID=3059076 RepID=A0AA51ZWD7_9BACT|nr:MULTISPECIES: penicillin-binding protein 2 [unclassified Marivirga]WMN07787.1 penicillin-binding protein 2 [Marivirga sp. ABR2-2]WNB17980.1 penicillin-binding protein 2 [Marivirga sp. BKB1-2]
MIENRKYIIQGLIILVGLVFIGKLFSIQVMDSRYKLAAENNVINKVVQYPYRGLILDRNNKIIVHNTPVYDIMVVPKEVEVEDTTAFCNLFDITEKEFEEKINKAKSYSYIKQSLFFPQLSNEEFAKIQTRLVEYKGFYPVARTVRKYPEPVLANGLGYIGEVSKRQLQRDTSNYYKQGDFIGISGIEAAYEEELRGKRGVKYKLVNVRGIEKGSFNDGQFDTLSVPGNNLVTTIDLELQKYAEYLMEDKVGSIVAIEPSTGEILAFVNSPSYDPNLLAGRNYSKNFSKLNQDTLKPLFNRPIMAQYRPGSVFKLVQSLIALQEGVIRPSTRTVCNRGIINCHGAHTNEDLHGAIKFSCNPYFYQTFRKIIQQGEVEGMNRDARVGLTKWNNYLSDLGFGRKLGVDIPNESKGLVPDTTYYDYYYKRNSWNFYTIYSLSIGEGELLTTPLQVANLASILANRGYFIRPHMVKGIDTPDSYYKLEFEKEKTGIDSVHFKTVVDAMAEIVDGTARIARVKDVEIAGKTGTVQNKNSFDHSAFMAFAPKENPQIAISVYVENAGWGGGVAAAITGLLIEKYIKGEVASNRAWVENYVMTKAYLNNL